MKKLIIWTSITSLILSIFIPVTATAKSTTYSVVVHPKYDTIRDFNDGVAAVRLGNMWGFIDEAGNEVISMKYRKVTDFYNGVAAVMTGISNIEGTSWANIAWYIIDKSGNETYFGGGFLFTSNFSEGMAKIGGGIASFSGSIPFSFVDTTGKIVGSYKYDSAEDFSEGLALVEINEKWGYINKSGIEVIPLKYEAAESFKEGLAAVKLNGKWGVIDKTGKEVTPYIYARVYPFNGGVAQVITEGNGLVCSGFINTTGTEVIPCKFSQFAKFSEGLVALEHDGKLGYYDTDGIEIIPPIYKYAGAFSEGLAAVKRDTYDNSFINRNGQIILSENRLQDERLYSLWGDKFSNGLLLVESFTGCCCSPDLTVISSAIAP